MGACSFPCTMLSQFANAKYRQDKDLPNYSIVGLGCAKCVNSFSGNFFSKRHAGCGFLF